MKKCLLILLFILFANYAYEQSLLRDLNASLSITKKDPPAGVKACLYAFQYYYNDSTTKLSVNISLKNGFRDLDKIFSTIKETDWKLAEKASKLLLEHYGACLKNFPLQAIQFLLMYDTFFADGIKESGSKFIDQFRNLLLNNGFLLLYQYYSQHDFHQYDDRKDVELNYQLAEKYGWVEQSEFYENYPDEIPVLELSIPLAGITNHVYDTYEYVLQNNKTNISELSENENWSLTDLCIVWHAMLDNFEKGIFANALYYGGLGKKAKIPNKYRYYYFDFLDDYGMVVSKIFTLNANQKSDSVFSDLSKNKYWKLSTQLNKTQNDASHGIANKADFDVLAKLLESERSDAKADSANYISDGWSGFDLRVAELYKLFGYKQEALFYLTRLKKLSDISITEINKNSITISEFIELKMRLATLYFGLTDITYFEKERKSIEKTFKLFQTLANYQEDGEINFVTLSERVKSIAQLIGTSEEVENTNKTIDSLFSLVENDSLNIFCETSKLLPMQFSDSLFVPSQTLKNWLLMTTTDKSSFPAMEKFTTVGYPLMYGVNKINLLSLFESYDDFLQNVNIPADFEPWYNYVIELSKDVSYTRPMAFDQFSNDFFIANLYLNKNYLDRADRIFSKWEQHCKITMDTNSIIYTYSLAGKIKVLEAKEASKEIIEKSSAYFEIVKVKGNCSQCYITAALQVAKAYQENIDTLNTNIILQDLIQKSSTGENISNDLKSAIWKKYLELLHMRFILEENNIDKQKLILAQISKSIVRGEKLYLENESYFLQLKKWVEIEQNILDKSASIEITWKDYLDSHTKFSKNQAYYTDRDRQVYFEEHLEFQDLLTWRYNLTAQNNAMYADKIFEYTMYYKSLSSGTNAEIKKYILQKKDSSLTVKWNNLLQMRSVSFTSANSTDFNEYQLEKELLLAMITDSVKTSQVPISTEGLRNKLDDKSYLVNIIRSQNGLNGELVYFAHVLSKRSANLQYILLGDGKMLEENGWKTYEKLIKQPDNSIKDTSSFGVYWKKFSSIIPAGSKVFVMNDGVYHKINLSSIYDPKNKKYLADEYEFRYVSDITTFGNPSSSFGKLIKAEIFGNPSFQLGEFVTDITINELANTQTECDVINNIISSSNNYQLSPGYHLGESASEEALKGIESPDILHIASHGFFVPSIETNKETPKQNVFTGDITFRSATIDFSATSDPLLRSGILLSGCSNTLNGHELIRYGKPMEDGILTAKELMQVNLDNTKLVVMSACETGLGDIVPGQGIAGLQKGFKTAGAENMVLTLWSVDDFATREFMELFYLEITKNIADPNCVEKSFFSTQNKFKTNPKFQHPFFWGAFVLVK